MSDQPWLKQVLADAKTAREAWPAWARNSVAQPTSQVASANPPKQNNISPPPQPTVASRAVQAKFGI